jgi:hypothetical protein
MPKYLPSHGLMTPGKYYGLVIQALQQQGAKRSSAQLERTSEGNRVLL